MLDVQDVQPPRSKGAKIPSIGSENVTVSTEGFTHMPVLNLC